MKPAPVNIQLTILVTPGAAMQTAAAEVADPTSVVLNRLDKAWDASDGAAFASEFTPDADVININGTHFRGPA